MVFKTPGYNERKTVWGFALRPLRLGYLQQGTWAGSNERAVIFGIIRTMYEWRGIYGSSGKWVPIRRHTLAEVLATKRIQKNQTAAVEA